MHCSTARIMAYWALADCLCTTKTSAHDIPLPVCWNWSRLFRSFSLILLCPLRASTTSSSTITSMTIKGHEPIAYYAIFNC